MAATYRQEREWLNARAPMNGNGSANYGIYRGYDGFSGQFGQSQIPNQTQMGHTLNGSASWSFPSMSSDYHQSPAAPQANSNWIRERVNWNNEMRRDAPYQAEPGNTMNRSWPGNGGPSNGSHWPTSNSSMQVPAGKGGLPDHIRRELTLLGATKRRSFFRYLDTGISIERALIKASEKRTSPARSEWYDKSVSADRGRRRPEHTISEDRVRKRANDDNASGGRACEEPKKQRVPGPLWTFNQNSITMAVMAENYPDCELTNQQLQEIEAGLVEELKKGWKSSINFWGIEFLTGMIQVVCMDKNSREWLEHAISKLTALPKTKLICCPEDEVPATKGITVNLPRSDDEPDKVTFQLLKDQNSDLLSKTWEFGRISQTKDRKVIVISCGIKSYNLLQKKGFCLSYRFHQFTCREISGKEALKAVRSNHLEANKSTAESSEIDLTEEDGEEFISHLDLTVVDEVRGDDDDENEMTEDHDEVEEVAEKQHDDVEFIVEEPGEEVNDEEVTSEAEGEECEEPHQEEENGNPGVVEDETCSL
ncbi:uncharacterized protein LOC6730798 isoform X1 [Drosophila simulans]|uniref:GD22789 n=3 Tax=Drosophila simulans TaxID=7240 RepID=B4Q912_DROSI|nr:uncharacterized protein LOC6730798 isoform X1 [Drosophila simulans]EDX03551.1 GD22789 [Drosophila simulans]KMY87784.1 uncharacterized protein Dsimw501_GD22789, isoform A [Drosophila simulans]